MDVQRFKHEQSGGGAAAASRKRPFAVVPGEFVVRARVQTQRMMPVWMAKVRWLVLRGSKSPILAAYRHVATFVMDEHPLRVMLLDADTAVHAVGEKGMVIVSSRVRRNDTWAMTFESSAQRRRMYELVKTWIELSAFLQSLTGFESIAHSESSAVYRCHDRADAQREYALKRVDRDKCAREIEVTEKLVAIDAIQPYIARYAFMFEDGRPNSVTIAMKHYKGGSLADRIRAFGFLPDSVVRAVMSSLCVALYLLHQHGILHLDVKAANVLFDADGPRSFRNLKLVDFGSSVLRSELAHDTTTTAMRTVAGTFGCMAPERFDGRYGPEADVYGAGVVLFHMVTGDVPFAGADGYRVMAKNMNGAVSFDHPRWRRMGPHVRELAQRMLEKDPDQRITLGDVIKLPWLCHAHSKEELVAVGALTSASAPSAGGAAAAAAALASPPFPPYMTRSDPFAFFA